MARDPYGGRDPRHLPAYTVPEAARYLFCSPSTLRSWVTGPRRLIRTPGDRGRLSFTNLVEAHVLLSLRVDHKHSMQEVRTALEFALATMKTSHPLAHEEFETDGVDIYLRNAGQLINASKQGQLAARELIERHLRRVERDEEGLARRLFPPTSSKDPAGSPRLVVIDPRVRFGRPVIAGTGVPTTVVVMRFHAGESSADLARDYGCSSEAIDAAIRCETLRREAA